MSDGIEVRHQRRCRLTAGGKRCSCDPSYRAIVQVRGVRDAKTFRDKDEARRWRTARIAYLRRHGNGHTPLTVGEAMEEMLAAIDSGSARARGGHLYKPSTARGYRAEWERYLREHLADVRLDLVRRRDVQAIIDGMLGRKLGAATIRQALVPLQALYRRAMTREWVDASPLLNLELPALPPGRSRAITPQQARDLIAAAPARERALWSTAIWAGLRVGELQALRPDEVDLVSRVIRIRHGFDREVGIVAAKHRHEGDPERLVPIVAPLHDALVEHAAQRLASGSQSPYLFTSPRGGPFTPRHVQRTADVAWAAAGLERLTFHECRHAAASLMRAAGVERHNVAESLGHADEKTTGGYVHSLPDWLSSARAQMDGFLTGTPPNFRSHEAAEPDYS